MSWEWLVVLVIMLAMNVFLFLVFWTAVQRADSQVREIFYRKLQDIHSMSKERMEKLEQTERSCEEMEERLQELQDEERKRKKVQVYQTAGAQKLQPLSAVSVSSARFRNTEIKEQYRYIRDHMDIDTNEVVRAFAAGLSDEPSDAEAYETLAGKFPFEARYELLTLSEEDQAQVLFATLSDTERSILNDYLETCEDGSLDVLSFFDYVESEARLRDGTIQVYTGDRENPLTIQDTRVRWARDPAICEGCRIRYRDCLYDYSL
ncbi:MAG: hypothetical protein LIO67_05230 [Lachnospiraceae bacterium]|nr:hypothetical protein [Lachnospiraceae bacterium]